MRVIPTKRSRRRVRKKIMSVETEFPIRVSGNFSRCKEGPAIRIEALFGKKMLSLRF